MIGNSVPPIQGGFRSPDSVFRDLGAATLSQLVTASSDIALLVDAAGVIRDASIGDSDLASRIGEAWIDKALSDTVTVESRGKVQSMMKVAPGDGLTWQEINHVVDGEDLPVRYVAVRLDPAGHSWCWGATFAAWPDCSSNWSTAISPSSAITPCIAARRRSFACCSRPPPRRC